MANLDLNGTAWHCNPCARSQRKWGWEQLKKKQTNQPFRPLHSAIRSRVTGVHREPDISLLWSLTTTNQSLLAMEQLSALHSIGEEGTSNPCSSVSVSPKITTNASVVKRLYVKRRGTGICFLHSEPRSHYNAAPSTKPGIAGVEFPPLAATKRGFLSWHQFISKPFV